MSRRKSGFTLIELSIVLVIIGLIVGGVLVGRDLISSAAGRAQLTQIEKFKTAVHTFYGKFGYLPGDIPDPNASQFGLVARGTGPAQGDGNGFISGSNGSIRSNVFNVSGESALFWVDLSTIKLIEGTFNTSTATSAPTLSGGTAIAPYLPAAALGGDGFVTMNANYDYTADYFTVATITAVTLGRATTYSGIMTVAQAYAMDSKIDDGLPGSGSLLTAMPQLTGIPGSWRWANLANGVTIPTTATAPSSTTCYDNGNAAGVTPTYSLSQTGSSKNCFMSFRM